MAIAARENDGPGGSGSNYGHVRVYKNISGTWTQVGADIDGEAVADGSGYSVALDSAGATVAIGAQNNDGNGTDARHVRGYLNANATCTITIPDANFKAYLVGNTAINLNGNLEIQCNEASAFTGSIICSGLNISDLTGIEAFTSLTNLYCTSNPLTSLDVSSNTALTDVTCNNNQLTSLNMANGNNTNITFFNALVNPNLSCIEVDDVTYSTTNWIYIDATASFSTDCSVFVGVEEVRAQMIRVYPNPATTQLTIENAGLEIKNISILDVTGKTVKTITQNTKTVNVSELVKGVYFLQIQTKKGITNSKFIKE